MAVASTVIFLPILFTELGSARYSILAIYIVGQAIFSTLDFGLNQFIQRSSALCRSTDQRAAGEARSSLAMAEVYGLMMIIFGVVFSAVINKSGMLDRASLQVYATDLPIVSFIVIFTWTSKILENAYRAALIGFEHHLWLAAWSAVFNVVRWGGGAFIVSWSDDPIKGFFQIQLKAAVLYISILKIRLLTKPTNRGLTKKPIEIIRENRQFLTGAALISFSVLLLQHLDKVVLSIVSENTDLGAYTFSWQFSSALGLVVGAVSTVFTPKLIQHYSVAGSDGSGLLQMTKLLSGICYSAIFAAFFFLPHITSFFGAGSNDFIEAFSILKVLLLGQAFGILNSVLYCYFIANKNTSAPVVVNIISVVILPPLLLLLSQKFGGVGAAWGTVASTTISSATYLFLARRLERHSFLLAKIIWTLTEPALLIGVIVIFKYLLQELVVIQGITTTIYDAAALLIFIIYSYRLADPLALLKPDHRTNF